MYNARVAGTYGGFVRVSLSSDWLKHLKPGRVDEGWQDGAGNHKPDRIEHVTTIP